MASPIETVLECPAEILSGIAASGRRKSGALRIGVLFGLHANGVVKIEGWRSVEASTQRVIPPPDDECLLRVVESEQERDAVGFFIYRRDKNDEVALTESEVGVFERVFPKYWQVALAMREGPRGCAARFFAREAADGKTVRATCA